MDRPVSLVSPRPNASRRWVPADGRSRRPHVCCLVQRSRLDRWRDNRRFASSRAAGNWPTARFTDGCFYAYRRLREADVSYSIDRRRGSQEELVQWIAGHRLDTRDLDADRVVPCSTGALLAAGRDLVGMMSGIRRSIRITPQAWLVAIVPLICILLFGSIIFALGWLFGLTPYAPWLRGPLLIGVAVVAIPCGILGFGASVAVPLGWAALANEQDPDALDSLSRGYEYLYRRPLKVVWYAMLSIGILMVIVSIALAIARAGETIAITMLALANVSEEQIGILHYFPVVVGLTLIWALVGAVYLLLRYDAGEQEVEDLWLPAPKPKPPLPQLPESVGIGS